jgi:aspartate-semialdehyde dehydrogenase
MAGRGFRAVVVGATGALGEDVLEVIAERELPLTDLVPVATDESLGRDVEFQGTTRPVLTGPVPLHAGDVVFLCVPRDAAAPWIRRALEAQAPCIDLSGSLAANPEVPIAAADLAESRSALRHPLVSCPPGPALALALALAPLEARFGLRRAVATTLESASGAGRAGVKTLEAEVVALFNQEEAPESTVFAGPVAFDCVPELEHPADPHGVGPEEGALVAAVQRLVRSDLALALTRVRVPTFAGLGASLAIETREPASAEAVREALLKSSGVELWDPEAVGPTTRDAVSRAVVLAGRVRRDPTATPNGFLVWVAADPVRLAASNAVRIAESHLDLH